MKRILLLASALLVTLSALAIPAKPGIFSHTQPDGSVVRLEQHGDEFLSWFTLAGTNQVVRLDADGYWKPHTITAAMRRDALESRRKARPQRMDVRPSVHTDNPTTHGEHHIPVILVEFSDVKFSLDQVADRFNRMLNETGYSDNGATGSVAQYYYDNSHGQYQPVFDVYGPVTLSNPLKYYGEEYVKSNGATAHDRQPELALYHACQLLDATVDFSVYDNDHNGYMDMVLFYYAGYSQAEHASSDAIWPHQHSVRYSSSSSARNATFDGIKLDKYFCTAELRGKEGTRMCGIGVTAHEFGHSLGLPDFYDTDYDENGRCAGLGYFSIMSSGSYNNDSRTPPYYNAEERIYLGWMTEDDILPLTNGSQCFGTIQNDVAYKSFTSTEGEYFLYECRDGSGWDSYIPQGLLVYHVDKSTVRMVGPKTPAYYWEHWSSYNDINAYGDHPCFYVIPAADQTNLNYKGELKYWVFPGSNKVKSFTPIDWEGKDNDVALSNISYANGNVSFTFRGAKGPQPVSFGQMGIPSIADPERGEYRKGDMFPLQLDLPEGMEPTSVEWLYDGEQVNASIPLKTGEHRVSAVIQWADGNTETLELLLHVQ